MDRLSQQYAGRNVSLLVLSGRPGRDGAFPGGARCVAAQNRGRVASPRSPSCRAWPVSARTRFFRRRPAVDHADALVAQDAASGNGMARATETGRSRASARELEKTLRTRRTHRMVAPLDA